MIPWRDLEAAWGKLCDERPGVTRHATPWSETLKKAIKARLNEPSVRGRDPLAVWRETVARIDSCPFACGEEPGRLGHAAYKMSITKLCQAKTWGAIRDREWTQRREATPRPKPFEAMPPPPDERAAPRDYGAPTR